MVGSKEQSDRVGNDQADESDQTANRDRSGGHQGGKKIGDPFHSLHIHPQLNRILLSQKNQVQLARLEIEESETKNQIWEGDPEGFLVCEAEVSHQPEKNGMEFLALRDGEEEHNDCREEGTCYDPCQKQGVGMDLSLLSSKIKDSTSPLIVCGTGVTPSTIPGLAADFTQLLKEMKKKAKKHPKKEIIIL